MTDTLKPETLKTSDKPIPPGLYLVATPIGNLEDITLRALRVLRLADRIACEDTRQTQKLLNHFGIHTPTVSYHLFNEGERAAELVTELKAGARIAIVSDAGTPGIADPGSQLAAQAIAAGVPVYPIPGANAAISALIASGLPSESFTFHGFLPSKPGQRRSALEALPKGPTTHILYESPHRLLETLADLELTFGPAQHLVVARELTKLHEEFLRGPVAEIAQTFAARGVVKGEIVLLLTLAESQVTSRRTILQDVTALMASDSLSEMDALKRVARERGIGKSEAYREYQREQSRKTKRG
ncbi:16S rRNA (cytidine(1402)-2'-O)-methyltransferase [Granulicella sp. WH15]|uniref:16S rRNA (cytidine(1402)-2'-O)-methyltransferase n=1 Tax=Granulicella sp. WH15 TaxID=2602070 RepID=UPI001366B40E|nr:16S rRNA (cytidine(1402)-2'-O)-methyltransferase [Granulicella sp. WH15]QHN04258.1 16S rRNA (cytidine(1402)-2'-O)-methyltransferase [Granulicella sp. WH15]